MKLGRVAKRPWWTKQRVSCPSCGAPVPMGQMIAHGFTCERCKIHLPAVDFWKLHHDKTSTTHLPDPTGGEL